MSIKSDGIKAMVRVMTNYEVVDEVSKTLKRTKTSLATSIKDNNLSGVGLVLADLGYLDEVMSALSEKMAPSGGSSVIKTK